MAYVVGFAYADYLNSSRLEVTEVTCQSKSRTVYLTSMDESVTVDGRGYFLKLKFVDYLSEGYGISNFGVHDLFLSVFYFTCSGRFFGSFTTYAE